MLIDFRPTCKTIHCSVGVVLYVWCHRILVPCPANTLLCIESFPCVFTIPWCSSTLDVCMLMKWSQNDVSRKAILLKVPEKMQFVDMFCESVYNFNSL